MVTPISFDFRFRGDERERNERREGRKEWWEMNGRFGREEGKTGVSQSAVISCVRSKQQTKWQKSFVLSARVPFFEKDRPAGAPPLVVTNPGRVWGWASPAAPSLESTTFDLAIPHYLHNTPYTALSGAAMVPLLVFWRYCSLFCWAVTPSTICIFKYFTLFSSSSPSPRHDLLRFLRLLV